MKDQNLADWAFVLIFVLLWVAFVAILSAGDALAEDAPHCGYRYRSGPARAEFQRLHPCPSTGQRRGRCPGYVVDHIVALACGGADRPENMQWQTVDEGRAKDRVELLCNG